MPVTALLAVTAAMLFGFQMWQWSLPRDTTVPSVVALPQQDAERELRDAGLDVAIASQRPPSETIPTGSVISTSPEGGRRVKTGRTVNLSISGGTAFTIVPDIRELSQTDARTRLRTADLIIANDEYTYNDAIPFDRVISITPGPGTRLKRLSTVSLVISQGPKPTSSESTTDQRSTVVTVEVPAEASGPDELRIDVTDNDGRRTIYQEQHKPGDIVTQTVDGTGKLKIEVYFGGSLLLTRKF